MEEMDNVSLPQTVSQKQLRSWMLAENGDNDWQTPVAEKFNLAVIVSWLAFSVFICSQPWVGVWANDKYHSYSPEFTVYAKNGSIEGSYARSGLCITPASEIHCTDGQNFTQLALQHRGVALGCGCGQGMLGESLCPMTSYGYTLSDYVSTPPAIACMLGFSMLPIMGTWVLTFLVNVHTNPTVFWARWHFRTLGIFHFSYVWWGVVTDCLFPTAHSVLTVVFLAALVIHWKITASLVIAKWGWQDREAKVIFLVAVTAASVMLIGAIPRVFLSLNDSLGVPLFPNLVGGIGAYAFWAGEALGLSLTFGAYPLLILDVYFFNPKRMWMLGLPAGKQEHHKDS